MAEAHYGLQNHIRNILAAEAMILTPIGRIIQGNTWLSLKPIAEVSGQ
jgi:hypothetical protein